MLNTQRRVILASLYLTDLIFYYTVFFKPFTPMSSARYKELRVMSICVKIILLWWFYSCADIAR